TILPVYLADLGLRSDDALEPRTVRHGHQYHSVRPAGTRFSPGADASDGGESRSRRLASVLVAGVVGVVVRAGAGGLVPLVVVVVIVRLVRAVDGVPERLDAGIHVDVHARP